MTLPVVPRFFCMFASLTLATSLSAGTIVFQRALPSANLNIAAGTSRSNISWAPGDNTQILGDDFTLTYDSIIDTLSVWEVSANGRPFNDFGSISLYTGIDNLLTNPDINTGSPLSLSSSTYTSSLVADYQYQGYGGRFYDVYKISFSNLNWSVLANTLYDFGIGFTPAPETTSNLFLHASNALLSGSTQDNADGLYLNYQFNTLESQYRLTAAIDSGAVGGGWDKSSDINVEIQGTTPEPATFGMFAISAGALLFLRRRRA